MAAVRRRTIFECCKWDPQFEDIDVLCPFALVLEPDEWKLLVGAARALTAEVLAAEHEILARPELLRALGLPRSIRRTLARHIDQPACSGPRVMRFDFHWTTEGWRISEVNSDVPGGFIEGSGFTQLIAQYFSSSSLTGDPASQLANALVQDSQPGAIIALVHATAYIDDRQVMIYLGNKLRERGAIPLLVSPADLIWCNGSATAMINGKRTAIDRIMRFYPGEWLPQLPRFTSWQHYFCASRTPQCNPASALMSQSKRFPLVWDELNFEMRAWRQWLPETRDPRAVRWRKNDEWVIKSAFGRVGDGIALSGATTAKDFAAMQRSAFWWPFDWVAQRRFQAIAVQSPDGPQYASIGVYTINGEPAGIYGRVASRPLVDHRARDVAVLVAEPQVNCLSYPTPEQRDESRASV